MGGWVNNGTVYVIDSAADKLPSEKLKLLSATQRAAYTRALDLFNCIQRGYGNKHCGETAEEEKARLAAQQQAIIDKEAARVKEVQAKFIVQQQAVENDRTGLLTPWVRDAILSSGVVSEGIIAVGQTILSFIPVIGPIVNMAISGVMALVNGLPLDQAFLEAMKNALPGGPVAKTAFTIGVGILSGKPPEEIGIDLLPIPKTAKDILFSTTHIMRALAEGKPIGTVLSSEAFKYLPAASQAAVQQAAKLGNAKAVEALLQQAQNAVPPELRDEIGQALTMGVAAAQAKRIQDIVAAYVKTPKFMADMQASGKRLIAANRRALDAVKLVPPDAIRGYEVATGVMAYKVNPSQFIDIRNALTGVERKAFDMAVSLYVGEYRIKNPEQAPVKAVNTVGKASIVVPKAVKTIGKVDITVPKAIKTIGKVDLTPPKSLSPEQDAAYVMTVGMAGATEAQRVGMLQEIVDNPAAKAGAYDAVKAMKALSKPQSWFERVLDYFGLL